MDEIRTLTDLNTGADINKAKERLAYEVTKLVHGVDEADKSLAAARALFGGGGDMANMPSTAIPAAEFGDGMDIITLLVRTGLASSNSDARRLVKDGGIYLNNQRVPDIDSRVTTSDLTDGYALLRKGKKVFHRVELS